MSDRPLFVPYSPRVYFFLPGFAFCRSHAKMSLAPGKERTMSRLALHFLGTPPVLLDGAAG